VHTVSELKKGAIIGDFDTLIANIQQVQGNLQTDAFEINRWVSPGFWVCEHVRNCCCYCYKVQGNPERPIWEPTRLMGLCTNQCHVHC